MKKQLLLGMILCLSGATTQGLEEGWTQIGQSKPPVPPRRHAPGEQRISEAHVPYDVQPYVRLLNIPVENLTPHQITQATLRYIDMQYKNLTDKIHPGMGEDYLREIEQAYQIVKEYVRGVLRQQRAPSKKKVQWAEGVR